MGKDTEQRIEKLERKLGEAEPLTIVLRTGMNDQPSTVRVEPIGMPPPAGVVRTHVRLSELREAGLDTGALIEQLSPADRERWEQYLREKIPKKFSSAFFSFFALLA